MQPLIRFLLIMILTIMLFTGCYDTLEYAGDGHLTDNGIASTERYILDFGDISLNQLGTKMYHIKGLPVTSFVVGIEINVPLKDQTVIAEQVINPNILLELSRFDNEIIFTKNARLDTWVWSTSATNKSKAFIYGHGEPGTYFQPLPQTEYALRLTVVEPDPSHSEYTASLVAKSGGWK